jgi:hypothetical protein
MRPYTTPLLFVCLLTFFFQTATAQNRLAKTLIVNVADSRTGEPVRDAEVAIKGLLSKQRKKTDSTGIASFKFTMISSSAAIDMEVTLKDGSGAVIASDKSKFVITHTLNEYQIPVSLNLPGTKKITVSVVDERNNPVAGARVQLGQNNIAYTRADGTIAFDDIRIKGASQQVSLAVEKPGFTGYTSTVELNDKTDVYTATALLKSEKSLARVVKVHVTAEDSGKPVQEAYVLVMGKSQADTYSGTTDQNGDVSLTLTTGGNFDILVKHDSYVSALQPVAITPPGDGKNYSLEFRLKRKM